MNDDLTVKVKGYLDKLEELKLLKVQNETKIQGLEEDKKECLDRIKALGYEDIEGAEKELVKLKEQLIEETNKIEQQMKEFGLC